MGTCEAVEMTMPLTARGNNVDTQKLIKARNNRSNPKCRGQLSLGDATKIMKSNIGFSNTPSSGRMQPKGFVNQNNKFHC